MRHLLLFSLCLVLSLQVFAQTTMFQRLEVPLKINGTALKVPFAGGLNNPQFSAADLNNDGILDLVIFDRGGDVVLTYLNDHITGQASYTFAPEYACNFPQMVDYALLRDYNKDGAADIFCASIAQGTGEMQVFKGYFENNMLKFKSFHFSYPTCPTCNPLYIWYPDEDQPGFWNNLPISKTDVPAVDDIDGDGDLDILAFPSGNSTNVWWFQNTSVEMGYGLDSLKFRAADRCWGKFYENGFLPCKASLSASPTSCSNGFTGPNGEVDDRDTRHPGATLTTLDMEGDGDKDLILGNVSFDCLGLLYNGGSPAQAWVTSLDSSFPSNDVTVQLVSFPASFYLDVNNDGKKDLLVAPNTKTICEDRKNVWYYENLAATGHQFTLQSKRFLVDDMLDLGSVTHPAFADVDGDGLTDLLVGNVGYFTPTSGSTSSTPNNASLYLFKNIGTPTAPAFNLVNSNYLNMASYAPLDFDFSPSFGDMDGDGDLDLLIGSNLGALYYFRNEGGPGNPMVLEQDIDVMWISMDVGVSSSPAMIDVDQDGKMDVLIGERQGNINYFRNIGTASTPKFGTAPTIQTIGGVDTDAPGQSVGFSTPVIVNTQTGPMMLTGSLAGPIEAYSNITATTDPFPQVSAHYGNVDDGARTHAAFADIDEDGILEMVVGNQRGGLTLYKTQLVNCTTKTHEQTHVQLNIEVAPNPSNNWIRINVPGAAESIQYRVYNTMGQLKTEGASENAAFSIQVSNWESGVYFMEMRSGNKQGTVKLLVKP
ncbi:MAG: T9SS type A sorting domain-containing protein [Bacteroidota bacterium]